MANQYGQLNLLKLFGAQATVDAEGNNIVVIPCDLNDIQLYTNKEGKIVRADLRISTNELGNEARMEITAKHKDVDNYTPPTHFIKFAMSKDSFTQHYQSAAAKQIKQHPELAGLEAYGIKLPDGDFNPLYLKVNNALRPILGELRTSGGTPQQFTGTAPQSNIAPQGGFVAPDEDDLPF